MRSESYKTWIDAMPIDDVRQKIDRLERKLADLHVLERLYEDRNGVDAAAETDDAGDAGVATGAGADDAASESEAGEGGEGGEDAAEAGSGEGGGGWTQGEGSPEHG